MNVYLVEMFDDNGIEKVRSCGVQAVAASLDAVDAWAREAYKDARRCEHNDRAWNIWIDGKESDFVLVAMEHTVYGMEEVI